MKKFSRYILSAMMLISGTMAGTLHAQIQLSVPQLDASVTESHGSAPVEKPLTAVNAFIDAPVSLFPTIDKMTRMDMVDYFNSGSQRPSKNAFKGDARIVSADKEQVTVETSAVSTVELSLLPQAKGDTIYMVITTLRTPAEDSSVKFYNRKWEEINKGLFLVPGLQDWVSDDPAASQEDIENAVPFMLVKCSYAPASGVLTLTNNIGEYLPEEVKHLAGDSLKGSLTYKWTGKKFE